MGIPASARANVAALIHADLVPTHIENKITEWSRMKSLKKTTEAFFNFELLNGQQ